MTCPLLALELSLLALPCAAYTTGVARLGYPLPRRIASTPALSVAGGFSEAGPLSPLKPAKKALAFAKGQGQVAKISCEADENGCYALCADEDGCSIVAPTFRVGSASERRRIDSEQFAATEREVARMTLGIPMRSHGISDPHGG